MLHRTLVHLTLTLGWGWILQLKSSRTSVTAHKSVSLQAKKVRMSSRPDPVYCTSGGNR
jgi:hypothetical protein